MRREPFRVGEALPVLLRDVDLMRVFNITRTRFYELKKAGYFDRFAVQRSHATGATGRPRGLSTLYSGSLVQRFLDGQLADTRYFSSARRRSA